MRERLEFATGIFVRYLEKCFWRKILNWEAKQSGSDFESILDFKDSKLCSFLNIYSEKNNFGTKNLYFKFE